jgi:serine/threonine protein kinase
MRSCPLCHAANSDAAAHCRACGGALSPASTPAASASLEIAGALPPITRLQNGAFLIERVIGQGGFGITYAGRESAQNCAVAIKEFFPLDCALRIHHDNRVEPSGGLSRSQFEKARTLFLDEARVLEKFHHPNIVDAFASFEEKNTAYMVMEYLHGETLLARIDRYAAKNGRGVPEAEAIWIIEQVGGALEAVHAAGLLHRDLKPENVLLCPQAGKNERVVLIDFGSARAYAANATTQLDSLVTHGYAPPEQYSAAARFGGYTDIYALGATLYHALVGKPPPAATDRAGGAPLPAPHALDKNISRATSDAVLWALQLNVAQRPQAVHQFLLALRGARQPPQANAPAPPSVRPRGPDPRAGILRQLARELRETATPPPSHQEKRLEEIAASLAQLQSFQPPVADSCPSCFENKLRHVAPPIGASQCPLCDGQLIHRAFDLSRCPICRQNALREYSFGEDELFCPLCAVAPLKTEERKKLLIMDLWLNCPNCHAQWDAFSNGSAKLMEAGDDKINGGRGSEYLHQTKPLAEWKGLSGRSDKVLRCNSCAAQLDMQTDGRAKLSRHPNDPFGAGALYNGKTFYRHAWARVALGLPLGAANCQCRDCVADWHFDEQHQTLKLLGSDDRHPDFHPEWKNLTQTISQWHFGAKHKTSARAGHVCAHCQCEFDDDNGLMRLFACPASTPAARVLKERIGQRRSLSDWHRIARALPDSSEEAALRSEEKALREEERRDAANWRTAQTQQSADARNAFHRLLTQSVLDGFLSARGLNAPTPSTPIAGEDVRWWGRAVPLKYGTRGGAPFWEIEREGTLLVTPQRVAFSYEKGELWSRPLNKLRAVSCPYFAGQPILEMQFQDLKKPLGLIVTPLEIEAEWENEKHRLQLTCFDLETWLRARR